MTDVATYRTLIVSFLAEHLEGRPFEPDAVTEGTDLFADELLDSLGFLELVTFLEGHTGAELDLTDVDPADLSTVGGLIQRFLDAAGDGESPEAGN